jgi:guanylate kinase
MTNKLSRYQDFKTVLATYHMSDRAKQALEGLHLVLLVAPTSTGRNTVIKQLVEHLNYYFVVSDTTREPQVRDGKLEENGVQYFFRTEEQVLADLEKGEFLEAALIHEQQVSGISVRELEKAKSLNQVAITDIEVIGADNILKVNPDVRAVFLLPPSFEVWQNRILSRGHMSNFELKNRLTSAVSELEAAKHHNYYHYVITEDVKQSAAIIDAIAHNKPNPHQGRGQELINHLEYNLKQRLESLNLGM